jgi:putative ATPase
MGLFRNTPEVEALDRSRPLADRMRPRDLDEYVGQEQVLGPGKALRVQIERDDIGSIIFWGPPGVGKTTLAKIIAHRTNAEFVEFSAVMTGIKEIKEVMVSAERARQYGTRTIVFIDEIHRFNKAQQDAFLPRVEAGDIVLIGATTENPSFEVNAALLSRSKVFVLHGLTTDEVASILRRALTDTERGLGNEPVSIDEDALTAIALYSNGDARSALNLLELSLAAAPSIDLRRHVDVGRVEQTIQKRALLYDKGGEEHYNIISALHKSLRNGDADASVYWLVRMLEGGEDPMYIARRLVRAASEDIGNADPQALVFAIAVQQTVHFLGMPEAGVALAQLVTYLAAAPKSNAAYIGYGEAVREVRQGDNPGVPLHIRNAPTRLMKDLGYGRGYQYAHDFEEQTVAMNCLPEALADRRFYEPKDVGAEAKMKARLDAMRDARKKQD